MGKVAHVFEFQMDVSDHPDSELVLMPQVNGPSGPSLGHWDSGNPFEFPSCDQYQNQFPTCQF